MSDHTNIPSGQHPSRRLRDCLEPFVGSVYFSPECHANYVALGFAPSRGFAGQVALPDGPAYFTSRGSVMGQVGGHVVAAAFGVFSPAAVVPSVAYGWTVTDANTICQARDDGAIAQLVRILTDSPAQVNRVRDGLRRAVDACTPGGRPLFSGLMDQAEPDSSVGQAWRAGDRLREFRGDAHNAAWTSAGINAVEIGLLTEGFLGLPFASYLRTRAWSQEEIDAALEHLRSLGYIDDTKLTATGHTFREGIERATDCQLDPALQALGDDADEICDVLAQWSTAVRAEHGYLAAGPWDLAKRADNS
jgi:hypothetical protein